MTASRYSLPAHIVERLQKLSAVQMGLDFEDRLAPTAWAKGAVAEALAALAKTAPGALDTVFIAASHEGGVTLEWGTDDDRQLIVSVPPTKDSHFSIFRYSVNPRFEEDAPAATLTGLPELLSWLTDGDGVRGRQFVNVADMEDRWDERFAAGGDAFARLADQALADDRAGRTALLDLDDR